MKTPILVLCAVLLGSPLWATEAGSAWLQVDAQGEVEAVPDRARITVRIAKSAAETGQAKREVDAISDAVLAAAARQGLKRGEIQAAQIRVSPEYSWQDSQRQLRGYRVERLVYLELNDVERYSALIDALVTAGATHIDSVQFELSQRDALELQAMERAMVRAKIKAKTLASASGRKLGAVERVVEGGGISHPAPVMAMRADRAEAAPAMPLGKQTVRKQLTVRFGLK